MSRNIHLYCLSSPQRDVSSFLKPTAELGDTLWFEAPLYIDRETNVFPPKRPISQRIDESHDWLDDLTAVDGLPQLASSEDFSGIFEIGGDSSGHTYYASGKTGRCYVWWHDPDRIEHVCDGLDEFLDWMIREQPEHPDGCSWATFIEFGWGVAPHSISRAHAKKYSVEKLCRKTLELGEFPVTHITQNSAHLLRPEMGQLIAMAHDLRGFRTLLSVEVSQRVPMTSEVQCHWVDFMKWLASEGFCDPDSPSVRGLEDEPIQE